MPSVIEVVSTASIGQVVEELALVIQCLDAREIDGQVLYLPL